LDLNGATTTIDAIGCQREIARQIVEKGVDHLLAVNEYQPTLHEQVKLFPEQCIPAPNPEPAFCSHEEADGDHGRAQVRRAWVTPAVGRFEDRQQWHGLTCFAALECEHNVGEKTAYERRYFISSLDGTGAAVIARAVRNHLSVENKLQRSLDRILPRGPKPCPQGTRGRELLPLAAHPPELAQVRNHLKRGIKTKHLLAGWDEQDLCQILQI
jgi:predicted transposase YbfD/YdcC